MKPLFTLGLDTSLNACSISIIRNADEKCLFSRHEPMFRGQAERLMPLIEIGLNNSNITYSDIEHIICTRGPGAFTGIRIGLATARGLCLSLNISGTGISTLQAVANTYLSQNKHKVPFIVCLETKRKDYYIQIYDPSGKKHSQASCMTSLEIQKICLQKGIQHICGDGIPRLQKELELDSSNLKAHLISYPDCALLVKSNRISTKSKDNTDYSLQPLYLREADIGQSK